MTKLLKKYVEPLLNHGKDHLLGFVSISHGRNTYKKKRIV
jgi:hypothetical protein